MYERKKKEEPEEAREQWGSVSRRMAQKGVRRVRELIRVQRTREGSSRSIKAIPDGRHVLPSLRLFCSFLCLVPLRLLHHG